FGRLRLVPKSGLSAELLVQRPASFGSLEAECHPEPAKDPPLMRRTRGADPSSPALREASLRAEPTGLPCAKRACERSPWIPPQDDIHARTPWEAGRQKVVGPGRLNSGDPGPDDPDVARAFAVAETHATRADLGNASQTPTRAPLRRDFVGEITVAGY